ncbi:MAG: hypothetical protein JXC36_01285 [Candidatus Atribacteria bacterium]|nr:hypothetical protein [Candidatus Atribacteria bacterium]
MKIAFMYVAKDADPKKHRVIVPSPEQLEMTVIAVKDFDQAVETAKTLVQDGIKIIELCGGFGYLATSRVKSAVGSRAEVGVVRFDKHPGLNGKSGDEVF